MIHLLYPPIPGPRWIVQRSLTWKTSNNYMNKKNSLYKLLFYLNLFLISSQISEPLVRVDGHI